MQARCVACGQHGLDVRIRDAAKIHARRERAGEKTRRMIERKRGLQRRVVIGLRDATEAIVGQRCDAAGDLRVDLPHEQRCRREDQASQHVRSSAVAAGAHALR